MRVKSCLVTSINDSFLWHKKLGHISMNIISKLVKDELAKDLPHIGFKKEKLCEDCKIDK
jgi:hypothetical protein